MVHRRKALTPRRLKPVATLLLLLLAGCKSDSGGSGASVPDRGVPVRRATVIDNLAPILAPGGEAIGGATVILSTLPGEILASTTSSVGTLGAPQKAGEIPEPTGRVSARFLLDTDRARPCLLTASGGRYLAQGADGAVPVSNDAVPRAIFPCHALQAASTTPGPLRMGPLTTATVDLAELYAPLAELESSLLELLDRAASGVREPSLDSDRSGSVSYLELVSAPAVSDAIADNFLENLRAELAAQHEPLSRRQPNIVVIMADDLGYGDVSSYYPGGAIATPHIDAIAEQGAALTNFHVYPVCASTRASWLAGRFTREMRIDGLGGPANAGIPRSARIIPEYLKLLGYDTALFGKWHLSFRDGFRPYQRGFDAWRGFYGGATSYQVDALREFGYTLWHDGERPWSSASGHATDVLADEAIDWIRTPRESPFFLVLSFNAPHTPWWTARNPRFASREDWRRRVQAEGETDNSRTDYIALVRHMDERIGDLLKTLEEEGLTRDTLVLFTSDNGADTVRAASLPRPVGSNGPFRGGKSTSFEGGVRVPLVAMWPGVIPAGQRIDEFTMLLDLWPTLREAAGFPRREDEMLAPRRGASLMPLLSGRSDGFPASVDRTTYLGFSFFSAAVIRYPWKLVREQEDTLYNLESDPEESRPQNDSEPGLLEELSALLTAFNRGEGLGERD